MIPIETNYCRAAPSSDRWKAEIATGSGQPFTARGREQLAQERLQNSGYAALRLLACQYHEGVLSVRGRVSTFYLRQVALTILKHVPGVEVFVDHIEVVV